MGLLDNFKRYVRGEDYDSDEYDEFSQPEDNAQNARWQSPEAPRPVDGGYTAPRDNTAAYRPTAAPAAASAPSFTSSTPNKVVNIHTVTQLSVVLVKPEKYENVSEVADHLKEKRTVVLNLEQTNRDVARRLLDFLSGVAYANEGKIKKIANSTYIITPHNIDIQGDIVEELENNGLYI